MKKLLLATSCLFFTIATSFSQPKDAKTAYTIQLGAFGADAKQYEFELIRSSAYVHGREGFVAMGMFYAPDVAAQFLATAQSRNYPDAFVKELNLAESPSVNIIQVITQTAGEPIEWANLESVLKEGEKLWVFPNENQVRIVIGTFEDIGLARARAAEIEAAGFVGSYARKVKSVLLSPVSEFEKSDTRPKNDLAMKGKSKGKKGVSLQYSDKTKVEIAPVLVKRNSSLEVQKVLKTMGHYTGSLDGKLGSASEAAYEAALAGNRRLQHYASAAANLAGFEGFEDVKLLVTMTRDLNPSNQMAEISPDLLLNLPTEPLDAAQQMQAEQWNAGIWNKLDGVAKQSKMADANLGILKLVYFKTLSRLEKEYSKNANLKQEQVAALSIWTLKTLVGDDLESL
jgi:hypothetical protein